VIADPWWRIPQDALLRRLRARLDGLSAREAAARLHRDGPNQLQAPTRAGLLRDIARRLGNPLILVLLCASSISAFTGDLVSFVFVAVIVLMSIALDMAQEHRAGRAMEALRNTVALRVRARRGGRPQTLLASRLVAGDVVDLSAGDLVPADGRVLSASHFFVNQASLTGEAWPVEKHPLEGDADGQEALARAQAVFMGSSVVAGSAQMLVCATGGRTAYGRVAGALREPALPTAFERGTHRFSILLARMTVALVLFVLLAHALHQRALLESFLFAVALAVGLAPELLPMIVSVTLARGSLRMARRHVIVKRLSAVHDLGAMDVLCTDKTGTLTEARQTIERVLDPEGHEDSSVFELAWLNSHFESGLKSSLDEAILAHGSVDPSRWRKLDEVAFDFERRRVSVLLQRDEERLLIVKGAPEDILRLSTEVDSPAGVRALDDAGRQRIAALFARQSAAGLRLLAVARRRIPGDTDKASAADEHDFAFAGFVAFVDPPKSTTPAALASLAEHGIALKIVTGDNEAVTRHLCGLLGIAVYGVLNGPDIAAMDDAALRAAAARANLFCRATPEQKSRIVRALQADGRVVGYLGDGINDGPPLHVADVGISVDSGAEVAKQAADLVLVEHDLAVLRDGVREGRRTMANVEKYVLMATSSNLGNMVSMAVAALFLPFLPMLPVQILLNNLLYDLSELPIPTDRVDEAGLQEPRRWDTGFIRKFMLCFGPLSSVFDLLAFALFYGWLHASAALFQTAWFVQSMTTQVLVIFVIRTRRVAWRDWPSTLLAVTSIAVVALAVALPYAPWGRFFGLVPLPAELMSWILALTLAYLVATEAAKHVFYRFVAQRSAGVGPRGRRLAPAQVLGPINAIASGGPSGQASEPA
jgi:Mg2+-importing ATPase